MFFFFKSKIEFGLHLSYNSRNYIILKSCILGQMWYFTLKNYCITKDFMKHSYFFFSHSCWTDNSWHAVWLPLKNCLVQRFNIFTEVFGTRDEFSVIFGKIKVSVGICRNPFQFSHTACSVREWHMKKLIYPCLPLQSVTTLSETISIISLLRTVFFLSIHAWF